jgi:hypothetical protein
MLALTSSADAITAQPCISNYGGLAGGTWMPAKSSASVRFKIWPGEVVRVVADGQMRGVWRGNWMGPSGWDGHPARSDWLWPEHDEYELFMRFNSFGREPTVRKPVEYDSGCITYPTRWFDRHERKWKARRHPASITFHVNDWEWGLLDNEGGFSLAYLVYGPDRKGRVIY